MIIIKKNILIGLTGFIFISGCMEPKTELLWGIETETIIETGGFCRFVDIYNDTAFIAAGQAGVQVWDLQTEDQLVSVDQYSPSQDLSDIAQVEYASSLGKLFALENNSRVVIMDFINGDSLAVLGEEMSEKTREIRILESSESYAILAADNDDGLKWNQFNYFAEWNVWSNVAGDELSTPGKPMGLDYLNGNIALAVDQQGVELWTLDSLGADPVFVNRLDTPGNAEKVTLTETSVFIACDDAGARHIPLVNYSNGANRTPPDNPYVETQFAEDLTVDHIAIQGNMAVLSLGSKGIALYDISYPGAPEPRGIFDVGYTYYSTFWEDQLVVCTSEGLVVLNIIQ